MSKDHNPTMSELIEFISALTGDVCSLIKADYATLAATVTGAQSASAMSPRGFSKAVDIFDH
jgi:hypothetical protein